MASEVKKFRQLLYEWLHDDVTALTAIVSTRIYPVWPPMEAEYPCCAYNLATRESRFDQGFPAWGGQLDIRLFATSEDTVDEMEDAIVVYVNANSTDMLGKLSDADAVKTVDFAFTGATQDVQDVVQDESFNLIIRVLRFDVAFVKREQGWS